MLHRLRSALNRGVASRGNLHDTHFQPGGIASGLLFLVLLFTSAQALASAGGRSGFSGDPASNNGATCNVCHAPDGAPTPAIGIIGNASIDAGDTQGYFIIMLGGPGQTAGVGIAAANGVGELQPANGDLQLHQTELTHTAPKDFADGLVTFSFSYTAPNYDTDVTLYATGNSTNGALDLIGDGIASGSLDITVTNGLEPPPDPPEPPVGELSAALFASGLDRPVAIVNAGDERLFVVERPGIIRIVEDDGTVVSTPFLNITSNVDSNASEQGLLGLAFHPDYQTNGYFYVYYIRDPGPGLDRTRVSRFNVSGNSDIAEASSELVLMEFQQPFTNHNGGDLHFGPQGYLHIASGDGGSGGDPQNNSQTTTTLLGKMLRIDVDTAPAADTGPDCDIAGGSNYSIPPGNAFNDGSGGTGCDEIFALGVRNPWRFTFDSATGAMWIADVGQFAIEEVNYLPAGSEGGLNLGWRCFEGNSPFNLDNCTLAYLPPVHTYNHATSGCSITGGRVYRGAVAPQMQGQYFFSDFCQSSIRAISGTGSNLSHRIVLPEGELSAVSTFGEDVEGEMYVGELNTGRVYRLDPVVPPGC